MVVEGRAESLLWYIYSNIINPVSQLEILTSKETTYTARVSASRPQPSTLTAETSILSDKCHEGPQAIMTVLS